MNNGRDFFDEPLKNNINTCNKIRKVAICLGDDYITGCLLDYYYFK